MEKKYQLIVFSLLIVVLGALFGYLFVIKRAENEQNAGPIAEEKPQPTIIGTPSPAPPLSGGQFKLQPETKEFVVESSPSERPTEKTAIVSEPDKLPEAKRFQAFSYDKNLGKIIKISGDCADAYYAVVIFRAADDYRKDPAAAVFNRAIECPANKKFNAQLNLKDFNLPSGQYYFLVADQGAKGSWYNPR